jgi:hypothetical protein
MAGRERLRLQAKNAKMVEFARNVEARDERLVWHRRASASPSPLRCSAVQLDDDAGSSLVALLTKHDVFPGKFGPIG